MTEPLDLDHLRQWIGRSTEATDIVTAPGAGGGPHIRVWDGATGALLNEIPQTPRTQGQHNIALVGAGRLGSAIASSPIFAEHGINIAAVFNKDPELVGRDIGSATVLDA